MNYCPVAKEIGGGKTGGWMPLRNTVQTCGRTRVFSYIAALYFKGQTVEAEERTQ